ncbi:MAG: helix-turn-helix transcriptional regulator [Mycoplasmataceae bacterium]|jgi:transcriptional regulator with XRE-family HTH domain|nr:helix-turn-helix transcriptional regulator [Mycoplasmataceae bacterium]
MATTLAKILKIVRFDHDEILFTMSRKLGISSAYLSAIENGKREIPSDFVAKLTKLYSLDEKTINQINEIVAKKSQNVKINISNSSANKKTLAINFARTFDDINEATAKKLNDLLNSI